MMEVDNFAKSFNVVLNTVSEIKTLFNEYYNYTEDTKLEDMIKILYLPIYNNFLSNIKLQQVESLGHFSYRPGKYSAFWEKDSEIYRECRGLVIDVNSMQIVLCPMRKFFNLNELAETSFYNVVTGIELSYSETKKLTYGYNIPMVNIETITFNEMISLVSREKATNKEGWVLNIDGYRVKVKCDDYINLAKVLDTYSNKNEIIKIIAQDSLDDLIAKIPEPPRPRLMNYVSCVLSVKDKLESEVNSDDIRQVRFGSKRQKS